MCYSFLCFCAKFPLLKLCCHIIKPRRPTLFVFHDFPKVVWNVFSDSYHLFLTHKKLKQYCPTTAEGSNDHFHVFEIWHKNQFLSNLSNIYQKVQNIWCLGMSIKGIWYYNNIWVLAMVTNLHKIIKIGQIIWSLLPFAVVFLKLAYLFCVQIVRKQQCFNIFFNFLKVLWFKPLLYRKILLFRLYLCQKVDFENIGHYFLLPW